MSNFLREINRQLKVFKMDICILCKSSKKDEVQYGNFLRNKRFGVHTFCLYLSSNLSQNGADDEGFLGFLESDIKKEVSRIYQLKCCYCNKRYANIGCCESKCRLTFHFICGVEHNAENRFCRDFRSYCGKHARKIRERPSSDETCLICYESVCAKGKKFNRVKMILTPCCRNGWFHKVCLQKFAKTAGYFFKCPLCNDTDIFREKLPSRGIFILNQDAEWELEPNAFAELHERPSECTAQDCKNKKGRKASCKTNEFIICFTCGSKAIHEQCLRSTGKQFHCEDCAVAFEEADSGSESLNLNANYVENKDEYIDVCHTSEKEGTDGIIKIIDINSKLDDEEIDSGTHEDEESDDEILNKTRKTNRILKIIDSDESDNGEENAIKPSAVIQRRSYSTDSDDSILPQGSKRRIMSGTEICKDIFDNKIIKPTSRVRSKLCATDSENSVAEEYKKNICESGNFLDLFGQHKEHNRNTPQLVFENHKKLIIEPQTNNGQFKTTFYSGMFKRRRYSSLNDSEDGQLPPNQEIALRKVSNNKNHIFNDSQSLSLVKTKSDDDIEDDDDPLEYFNKFIRKRNNSSSNFTKCQQFMADEIKNFEIKGGNQTEPDLTEENSKGIKFNNLVSSKYSPQKSNPLDLSCIANRTRRKSSWNIIESDIKEREVARRKTISVQTEYSREMITEMSEIFEKLYESSEDVFSVDSDPNFIVNDGCEEKRSTFEMSCIANRTRKRRRFRSEISSTAPKSSDLFNNNSKRCHNRLISSYSVDKVEIGPTADEFAIIKRKPIPSSSPLSLENSSHQNINSLVHPTTSQNITKYQHMHYGSDIQNRNRF